MENQIIKLKEDDVLDLTYLPGRDGVYAAGNKLGQPFFLYAYGGHVGVVDEATHDLLQSGELASVVIEITNSEGTREVLNEDTNQMETVKREIKGLNISSFTTYGQLAAMQKNKVVLVQAQAQLDVVRAKARKELAALEVE